MKAVQVGDAAPDFMAQDQNGQTVELSAYRGRHAVVIFFYPADGSPVCTKEACVFRDAFEDFTDAGAVVMGVSGDGVARHQQFAQAHRLPFLLLADDEGTLRRAFGVPNTMGVLPGRVTYVIDKRGIVRHMFKSQLQADRHVTEALAMVRQLQEEPA